MTGSNETEREMGGMSHISFEIEAGTTAKYHQVADWFASRILSGELRPGERLPSDRQLAKQLNLSPTTTTAAMPIGCGIFWERRGAYVMVRSRKPVTGSMRR